jgi:hypothetical protein
LALCWAKIDQHRFWKTPGPCHRTAQRRYRGSRGGDVAADARCLRQKLPLHRGIELSAAGCVLSANAGLLIGATEARKEAGARVDDVLDATRQRDRRRPQKFALQEVGALGFLVALRAVALDGRRDVVIAHVGRELDNPEPRHVDALRAHSIFPVAGL